MNKKIANASDNSVAVAGNIENSSIVIGLTLEQYKNGLREREKEVREQLKEIYEERINTAHTLASEKALKAQELELKLVQIRNKISSIEEAYEQAVIDLKNSATKIEELETQITDLEKEKTTHAILLGPQQAFLAWRELADGKGAGASIASFEAAKMAELIFDYDESLRLYLQAANLDKSNSVYLNAVGCINYLCGRFPEAKVWHTKALEAWSNGESEFKSTMQHNLAEIYREERDFDNAEILFFKALEYRKTNKLHHLVAGTQNNLGGMYKRQWEGGGHSHDLFIKAEDNYLKSIELFEQEFGVSHPSTLRSKNNLGLLYLADRRFNDAKDVLEESLKLNRKHRGGRHPDTAVAMTSLAGYYQERDKFKPAEKLYKEAKKILEHYLGDHHPHVGMCWNNMAGISSRQRKFGRAVKRYKKAQKIFYRTHGPTHERTIATERQLVLAKENYRAQ